jgi:hypothetical protein
LIISQEKIIKLAQIIKQSTHITYLSVLGEIIGAVGNDFGQLDDPFVDVVASTSLHFVVVGAPSLVAHHFDACGR